MADSSGANTYGLSDFRFSSGGPASQRAEADVGEFDWGAGLTPPGCEDAPLSEGGMYRGKAPPCEKVVGCIAGRCCETRLDSSRRVLTNPTSAR